MMTKNKLRSIFNISILASSTLVSGLALAQQVPNSLPTQAAAISQAQPQTVQSGTSVAPAQSGLAIQQTNQVSTSALPSDAYVPPAKSDISYKAFTPEGIMIIQKEVSEDARLERSAIPSDLDFSEFKKIGLNDPARLSTYSSLNKLREDSLKNKVSYRAKHVNADADVSAKNKSIWSTISENLLALGSISIFIICFIFAMAPSKPPKDIFENENETEDEMENNAESNEQLEPANDSKN